MPLKNQIFQRNFYQSLILFEYIHTIREIITHLYFKKFGKNLKLIHNLHQTDHFHTKYIVMKDFKEYLYCYFYKHAFLYHK